MKQPINKFAGKNVCEIHGPYEYEGRKIGTIVLGNVCPQCQELMFERNDKELKEKKEKEDAEAWEFKLKTSGLPNSFRDVDLKKLESHSEKEGKMHEFMRTYVRNFSKVLSVEHPSGVIFSGTYGSGKTTVAAAMVTELLKNGYGASYLSCNDFLLRAKEAMAFNSQLKSSALIDKYTSPHFLVMDEFGAHSGTEVDFQLLFSIINGRYLNGLPTLLVTNMPASDLNIYVDQRILERVKGKDGPHLNFDWNSYRKK